MNRYQKENAAWLVDGYFSVPAHKRDGEEGEFSRAKAELLGHLKQQMTDVESLRFDDFSAVVRLSNYQLRPGYDFS